MTTTATRFAPGHVGLNVADLARSRDFYAAVFGFAVRAESTEADRRFAFLGDDERLVLTLWEQSEGRFGADRPGLHHLAFQVGDIAEVEAVQARLRELGAEVLHDGIVPHGEGASSGGVFFTDPDGIRLEVYAPAGAEAHGAAPSGAAPTCGFF
jgi:catechol 2,3-dioxygenase-like lactoylglutathione lyase family enzyme